MTRLRYLTIDLSDDLDGPVAIEAMAATAEADHPAVMAEVGQVMDWARRSFPHTQGPAEDGGDWDHDLQVLREEGGWVAVSLTLSASARFAADFRTEFEFDGAD